MTEIATIDWFGKWRTSVFSENTAIFVFLFCCTVHFSVVAKFHSVTYVLSGGDASDPLRGVLRSV